MVGPFENFFHSQRLGGSYKIKKKRAIESRGVQPEWETARHEFNKIYPLFSGFDPGGVAFRDETSEVQATEVEMCFQKFISILMFRKKKIGKTSGQTKK